MSFNFSAPPAASAGTPAASAPAASAFGAPANAPINAAQALAGFGDAEIDLRDPFPPVGFAGLVEVLATEGKGGRNTGFGIYIRARVTAVASPGGGAHPAIKNCNPIPAAVGQVYSLPIRGFGKPDAEKFAHSDLKCFIAAALEHKGLTAEVQAGLTPADWAPMGQAAATGQLQAEGGIIGIQTSEVLNKGGLGKLKVTFYRKSQVAPGA